MHRVKGNLRLLGLGVVVVAVLAVSALSGSCLLDTTTSLCEATGLRCRPGQVCAADQAVCIDIGGCGDGIVSAEEVCDDGNIIAGDDCSEDCRSNETCGNGIVDVAAGETCDRGDVLSDDGCSPLCILEACGNRVVDVGEECDTGGEDSRVCDDDCTPVACGDGHVNTAAHEACEPDPQGDTSSCDGDCTVPECGDKHTNPNYTPPGATSPEQCDAGEDTSTCDRDCTRPACGDGHRNPKFKPAGAAATEACDDGNNENNDSCLTGVGGFCRVARCGDGFHRTVGGSPEECDDGDANDDDLPDACRTSCRLAFCGDGVFDTYGPDLPNDECDDGNGSNTDSCVTGAMGNCQMARCGDGYVWTVGSTSEQCDTGDVSADSATCDGHDCTLSVCGDGHINLAAGEECDPGGPGIPSDGCAGDIPCKPDCSGCLP